MNKKLVISLFIALFVGANIWSLEIIRPHSDDIYGLQVQIPPSDYFFLGSELWMEEIERAGDNLDELNGVLEQVPEQEILAAQYEYNQALDLYFTALIKDIDIIKSFFEFGGLLDPVDRQEMATRFLNVVLEYQQFLASDESHASNIEMSLGYPQRFVNQIKERVEGLVQRLNNLVPHEVDDMSDIEQENDDE